MEMADISWLTEIVKLFAYLFIFLVGAGVLWVIVLYIIDVNQTTHAIRRNFPVVGRFRYMFEHLGEFLPNRHWSAMRGDWFEEVDGALEELEVAEEVFRTWLHLAGRGAPIELPPIDDFPAIGYLREAEIAGVAIELEKVDRLDAEEDTDVRESLNEVRAWLKTCARSHRDLICFYH